MEIQAIAYYRLNQDDSAVSKIVAASEKAIEENFYFKPIFSAFKEGNLLTEAKHKCD